MNIKTKDLSIEQLGSFINEYIVERDIHLKMNNGLNIPNRIGLVMNDDMFDTLCREMDERINKMTTGVRHSVRQSGRAHVRPLLFDLIPMIPRIDERVVLAAAYQNVFGRAK